MHSYGLLVPSGLEGVAVKWLPPELAEHVQVPPLAPLPPGTSPGAAGAVSPILARSEQKLADDVLASPCLAAALALIFHGDLSEEQCTSLPSLTALLMQAGVSPAWRAALATWAAHHGMDGEGNGPSELPVAYRVAVLRCGTHGFTSKELEGGLGAAISLEQPRWHVSLPMPNLLFVVLLVHRRATFGLLLPPFEPRSSDVLPLEPRTWLRCGRERPHTRPSRAALLVRLAGLRDGERLLDPCGGIGVLSIEAAILAGVHAISLDTDAAACRAAAANASAATWILRGRVSVMHGDCTRTPLPPASIDVAIADLPFGMRHAKLDCGALIRYASPEDGTTPLPSAWPLPSA